MNVYLCENFKLEINEHFPAISVESTFQSARCLALCDFRWMSKCAGYQSAIFLDRVESTNACNHMYANLDKRQIMSTRAH